MSDHGHKPHIGEDFFRLTVADVVRETPDASSFVFEVPESLAETFAYESGQFVTVRAHIEGTLVQRCYSMSSTPGLDQRLRVTVKRVAGGPMSNWLATRVAPGAAVEVSRPGGRFVLRPGTAEVVLFAAGSGITPVLSMLRTVLSFTERKVALFYANRDAGSVIFAPLLAALEAQHPDRLRVRHHHDSAGRLVEAGDVRDFVGMPPLGEFYLCGPAPFMEVVETSLKDLGAAADRIHLERFVVNTDDAPPPGTTVSDGAQLTIELGGKRTTTTVRAGQTLLTAARATGLPAPYSCELGTCGTCMARIVEGEVALRNNDVLDDDEIDEGWTLMCQALPVSGTVHAVYE